MAKDHYVAQTYLKQFHIKEADVLVNAIRKKDLKHLHGVHTETICQKSHWSDSPYHENPRVVEDYLKFIEPKWLSAVESLRQEHFDSEIKYILAGYIVYLRACTPTAIRLGQQGFGEVVKSTYGLLERRELEKQDSPYATVIKELRKYGGPEVDTDENFVKAIGIKSLNDLALKFYKFPWLILQNETEIPFITSDNPVCLDFHSFSFVYHYFPITPRLAVVIKPTREDLPQEKSLADLATVNLDGVNHYNRLVIKSAENLVVFNCEFKHWIKYAVKKYRNWRCENYCARLPSADGIITINQQRPVNLYSPKSQAPFSGVR